MKVPSSLQSAVLNGADRAYDVASLREDPPKGHPPDLLWVCTITHNRRLRPQLEDRRAAHQNESEARRDATKVTTMALAKIARTPSDRRLAMRRARW